MVKNTSKIVKELKLCDDFKTFYHENREYMVDSGLPELLEAALKKTGMKKSEVIKSSELSEIYAYQIFSGIRKPDRKKLLSLCVAMGLNIDDIQALLKSAGYAQLYVKVPFDSVVLFGICKKLSVIEINELLFEYELETLG